MSECTTCDGGPGAKAKNFPGPVIEIKNPEQLVLLRKVLVPASMGDDTDVPASIGKYRNVILYYEANRHTYIYSSDGIPTLLEADVPQEILDRIVELEEGLETETIEREAADSALSASINSLSSSLLDETTAREEADAALGQRIDSVESDLTDEITTRTNADTALGDRITTEETARTNADAALQNSIDTVSNNLAAETTARQNADTALGDRVTAIESKIPNQATAQNQLADKAFVNSSIATNTANYISDNGQPFQSLADLEAYSGTLTNNDYAFVVGTDASSNTTYTRYKYNADTQTWAEEYVLNNSSFTAVQWAAINSGITSGNVDKLVGLANIKTIGANLNLDSNGELSATDTTYTAGANVQISAQNVISATDTTYTAGANIQISPQNVISATDNDTTYTAGNGITIDASDNNRIDAAIYPEDFFTADATTSGEGSEIELNGTIPAKLSSVELFGDTFQQTYSGKNLYEGSQDFSGTWNSSQAWITEIEKYNGLTVLSRSGSWTGIYKPINVEAGKTYTFSVYVKSSASARVNIYLLNIGTATAVVSPDNTYFFPTANWQRYSITFTVTSSGTVCPRVENSTNQSSPTYICGYQLEEGSSMTDYEPYVGGTASPNPDYPQEVQTVTGEQTVEVRGKNLYPSIASTTANGITFALNKDGTYNISGTATAQADAIVWANDISGFTDGGTYTLSVSPTPTNLLVLMEMYDGVTWKRAYTASAWPNPNTFTLDKTGANRIKFSFRVTNGSTVNLQNVKVQLESGATATEYQPYQSPQSYEVNLGKNLFDLGTNLDDYFVTVSTGTQVYTDNDKSFVTATFNGNILTFSNYTTTNWRWLSKVVKLQKNTTYTISGSWNSSLRIVGFNSLTAGSNGTLIKQINPDAEQYPPQTFDSGSYEYVVVSLYPNEISGRYFGSIQIEKGSTATDYAPYFTPIELCKIGDYQDSIYKSGGDWYVHKETGKYVANGNETYARAAFNNISGYHYYATTAIDELLRPAVTTAISSHYVNAKDLTGYDDYLRPGFVPATGISMSPCFSVASSLTSSTNYQALRFAMADSQIASVDAFKSWLSSHNTTVYYALAIPTDTKITDATLIAQLNALASATGYNEKTYLTVSATGTNLPALLSVEAYTESLKGVEGAIAEKQDKLTAGTGITIAGNTISSTATIAEINSTDWSDLWQ